MPNGATDRIHKRSERRSRRRRLGIALLSAGTFFAAISGAVMGFSEAAFANAANPAQNTGGTATTNADGSVTVNLQGGWTWPGQDCKGRYGEGFAVDWWGVGSTPSFSLVSASSVTSPSTTGTATNVSVAGTWQAASGAFHVAQTYAGQVINSAATCTDTNAGGGGGGQGSSGSWAASATYPNAKDVPAQLCVIFYDEHGNEGKSSGSAKDFDPVSNDDNSIHTNAFDPAGGSCFSTPVVTPPKYNCAPAQSVTATTATLEATTTDTTASSATFSVSGGPSTAGTPALSSGNASEPVTGLQAGNNYTYSATFLDANGKTLGTASNCSFATPQAQTPNLTIVKSGPATGTAGQQGTYTMTATNSGNAPTPTPVVITDNLPVGETFVSSSDTSCTQPSAQVVSCPVGVLNGGSNASITITVSYALNTSGQTLTDCATASTGSVTTSQSCVNTVIGAQGLNGHIFLCNNNTASTAEVPGGTLSASGPTTVASQANPLSISNAQPGTYNMSATAPSGYSFVATCGSGGATSTVVTPTNATENVAVPANGSGTGIFYVTPNTPTVAVGIVKSNNASNPNGTNFQQTETAQTLGESFTYQAIITNTDGVAEVISAITDTLPGQSATDVCANLIGTTLQPAQSVTCQFPGTAPSDSGDSITDTVSTTVTNTGGTGTATGTSTSTANATSTSTVITPPTVTITKGNNADGTGYSNTETAAASDTDIPYQVIVTNNNASPATISALTDAVGGTTSPICPNLINQVLQPGQSATCDFTGPVPASPTTDTASVTFTVNGTQVSGTAQSTVLPPPLGLTIAPASTPAAPITPAPAPNLPFTGFPTGKVLMASMAMILAGFLLVAGDSISTPVRRLRMVRAVNPGYGSDAAGTRSSMDETRLLKVITSIFRRRA